MVHKQQMSIGLQVVQSLLEMLQLSAGMSSLEPHQQLVQVRQLWVQFFLKER
jgi:hypothetical protein